MAAVPAEATRGNNDGDPRAAHSTEVDTLGQLEGTEWTGLTDDPFDHLIPQDHDLWIIWFER